MRLFHRLRCARRPLGLRRRLLLLTLLLGLALYLRLGYLPTAERVIRMEIDDETSNLINEAVDAYLAAGQIRYEDLICLEKTDTGAVAAARVDLAQVNHMKSVILAELDSRVPARVSQSVRIPLGSLFFPALLSGRGGSLPVRVLSLRSTNAALESSLSQAGINQTLHCLELRVEVELLLLTPAGLLSHRVDTLVPIAQTILLGDVPGILLRPEASAP